MEVIPKEERREREIRMQNITGQKIEEEERMRWEGGSRQGKRLSFAIAGTLTGQKSGELP